MFDKFKQAFSKLLAANKPNDSLNITNKPIHLLGELGKDDKTISFDSNDTLSSDNSLDSNNSNVTNENKKGLLNSVKRLFKGKSASLTKEANDGNHDRVLFSSPVKSIANKTAQGAVKGLVTEIKAQIEENFGLEDMDLQEMSSNMTKGALEAGGRYVSKSLTPANVTLGTAVIAAAMITVSKASEGSIVGAAMSLCAVNLLSKAFQHANHKGNWQEKVATPATEETSRAH